MSDVRIVIGRKYEVMQPERREATAEFAHWLRSTGVTVDLEIIEYEPGRRGLGPVEWTLIFIGTNVAIALIGNVTTDIYNGAKKLLRNRRNAKLQKTGISGPHLGFKIYGPDGKLIVEWTTREDEATITLVSKSSESTDTDNHALPESADAKPEPTLEADPPDEQA